MAAVKKIVGEKRAHKHYIKIARDYTRTPGFRRRSQGDYSGEEFREDYLQPAFDHLGEEEILVVDLDGARGYATSFLEEVFGGMVRKNGYKQCQRIEIVCLTNDVTKKLVLKYMEDAKY